MSINCNQCGEAATLSVPFTYFEAHFCQVLCRDLFYESFYHLDARKRLSGAKQKISRSASRSKSRGRKAAKSAKGKVSRSVSRSKSRGRKAATSARGKISRSVSRSKSRGRKAVTSARGKISRSVSRGREAVKSAQGKISRSVSRSVSRGREAVKGAKGKISRSVSRGREAVKGAKGKISRSVSRGREAVKGAKGKISRSVSRSVSRGREAVKGAKGKISRSVSRSVSRGREAVKSAKGKISRSVSRSVSRGREAVKSARGKISRSVSRGREAIRRLTPSPSRSGTPSISPVRRIQQAGRDIRRSSSRGGTSPRRGVSPPRYLTRAGYEVPVRGSALYWEKPIGFGNNLRWARLYPWWLTLGLYPRWYIYSNWIPYYTIAPTYWDYIDRGVALPPEAYIYTTGFPQLPPLPAFSDPSVNIDVTPLRIAKTDANLGASERALIQETMDAIDGKLTQLRAQNLYYISQGYMIVPDLDTERFTWVRKA